MTRQREGMAVPPGLPMPHAGVRAACVVLGLAAALAGCSPEPSERRAEAAATCSPQWTPQQGSTLRGSFPTDSGMHGLWSPEAFRTICDFKSWEKNFVDDKDIERHIAAGRFVPIYVHSDGNPLIEVRLGLGGAMARFDPGADALVVRRSKPYLYASSGAFAVSGIEYINGSFKEHPRMLALPAGRWVVDVLEIDPRPGLDSKIADQVPNFVVLVNPEPAAAPSYRTSVETFD